METLEAIQNALQQLSAYQIAALVAALVVLVIGLRLIFKKQPAHLTAFSGGSGAVLVSRKALQDLVRQACLLDEWVEAARPQIRVRDGKVAARVELRISSPQNLKEVCERVQGHITSLLQKSLSFDQIGEIQIVVKSFGKDASERDMETEVASDLSPALKPTVRKSAAKPATQAPAPQKPGVDAKPDEASDSSSIVSPKD